MQAAVPLGGIQDSAPKGWALHLGREGLGGFGRLHDDAAGDSAIVFVLDHWWGSFATT